MSACDDTVTVALTEEDIPGAKLDEPVDRYTIPELKWWLLCRNIKAPASWKKQQLIAYGTPNATKIRCSVNRIVSRIMDRSVISGSHIRVLKNVPRCRNDRSQECSQDQSQERSQDRSQERFQDRSQESISRTFPGSISNTFPGSISRTFPGSISKTFPRSISRTFPGSISRIDLKNVPRIDLNHVPRIDLKNVSRIDPRHISQRR